MAGLRALLGLYPKTTTYEEQCIELRKEFSALQLFATSEELRHFQELEETVTSEKFKLRREELLRIKYKGTEAFDKEQTYQRLHKDSEIKLYYKTLLSDTLKLYFEIHESEQLKQLHRLQEFVNSDAFLKEKAHYQQSAKKRFELSELGQELYKYNDQSRSTEIKSYFKFISDKRYPDYSQLSGSEKLARYEELKTIVESHEFVSAKKSMSKAEFQASEMGKQWVEYLSLSKSKDIRNYIQLEASALKKYYDTLHNSAELSAYEEHEKFVLSHDFALKRKAILSESFSDTEAYKKLHELELLQKSPNMKSYFSFSKSKEFENYNRIHQSEKLLRYKELSEYVKSEEFLTEKAYLNLSPQVRWKQSEEYKQLDEYNQLKGSEKIKWFYSQYNAKRFEWLRTWSISFSDEFDSGKLDKSKWLTRYFWGDKMLQKSYSLAHEKHFITDGNNLDLSAAHLKIITRKEKADGLKWNPELGFVPSSFEYTSGLVNTGNSFRQQYGYFEAKIKLSANSKILNAFWMVGDEQTPHIDVVKANGKCSMGIHTNQVSFKKTLGRSKFAADYFIYGMEWSANRIAWFINGLEVASTNTNIPQQPMYIALSAGLYEDLLDNNMPAMEVDWVRCYKKVKE
ncbi:MAG: glycoside hydrolase family 16 protein [Bacteroidota bacterium]|nr:MAG: glycoside hydrolase family 16 protein [Bacteroidota bacterium]